MATEFGKYLRRIRLENDEILKNMADKLGISSSYLSAVENGKRNIPEAWIEKISKLYHKNYDDVRKIAENSLNEVNIKLDNTPQKDKELVISFARNFNNLSSKEKNDLIKMLNKKERND